jgi:hypothetical protein
MAGFNISTFRADIDRRGVMRTNRASILFAPPRKLSGDTRNVALRCDMLSLPSVYFSSDDKHNRYGVGPTDVVPLKPLFDPINFSFIADKQGEMHRFFYEWAMLIGNFDHTNGQSYEAEYAIEYQTDMMIIVFDESRHEALEYRMHNAYVAAIAEVPMAWGDTDNFVRINVTINFRDWRQRTNDGSLYNTVNNLIASVDKVLGTSVRIPNGVLDVLSFF